MLTHHHVAYVDKVCLHYRYEILLLQIFHVVSFFLLGWIYCVEISSRSAAIVILMKMRSLRVHYEKISLHNLILK
jgi:hypothetical protein